MNYQSVIESILYVCGEEGVEIAELHKVLNLPTDEVRSIVKQMIKNYDEDSSKGVCIKLFGNRYYLLTKECNNEYLKILNTRVKKINPLTPTLLETLAIIAYNQPCTKTKIEEIRNSDPSFAIARLTELGLIESIGKAPSPGNPYQYQVTQKFFNLFGIKSLKDLPPLKKEVNFEFDPDDDLNFFDSARK